MTAHAIRHFDALSYVDQSKSLGVNENVAKYQARQMEQLLEMATENARVAIEAKELATKKDLTDARYSLELKIEQNRAEILRSKIETITWMAGMFIASGLIQHFFK